MYSLSLNFSFIISWSKYYRNIQIIRFYEQNSSHKNSSFSQHINLFKDWSDTFTIWYIIRYTKINWILFFYILYFSDISSWADPANPFTSKAPNVWPMKAKNGKPRFWNRDKSIWHFDPDQTSRDIRTCWTNCPLLLSDRKVFCKPSPKTWWELEWYFTYFHW